MGLKQRVKGKVGERQFCTFLRQYRGATARRTKQHDGQDSPDIETNVRWGGCQVVWEVTTAKDCRIGTAYLRSKWEQVSVDCAIGVPVVAWKEYGRGWRVTWWNVLMGLLVTADADEFMQALGYKKVTT